MANVTMPQLGETVADGTVTKWFKNVGDTVVKGEPLFEVSTDKVDTEIPAPATGVLSAILVEEGETVDVGTVLAVIGGDEATTTAPTTPVVATTAAQVNPVPVGKAKSTTTSDQSQLSPVVRRLIEENGLDVADITGTGPSGRITRSDVDRLIAEKPVTSGDRDQIVPFTKVRRLTAEHMVRSKATSAHTLMVREVDYEQVELARAQFGPQFKEREGFALSYLPFNAIAVIGALQEYPRLNASVAGDELIVHLDLNLGIAVDVDNEGLVVPVIRSAELQDLTQLARAVRDVAERARSKRLGPDELTGGTFTISNPGPFGTLFTGAIINQPQVAILSTDSVVRKPVVVTTTDGVESIGIHSVGMLALTFDHRAVDGAYAARFLRRMSEILTTRDWVGDFS